MQEVDGGRQQSAKRGVKRSSDDSNLSDEQRFAKRFNLLNLDTNAYLPSQPSHHDEPEYSPRLVASDGMQIDDTRDRIYINDIDAEIADIEANEPRERLIFLPDIEKHFSRIPEHVLTGRRRSSDTPEDQQLVLYDVPKSLTTDASHDVTRKTILEARRRAQDKAAAEARKSSSSSSSSSSIPITEDLGQGGSNIDSIDPDAMDIE